MGSTWQFPACAKHQLINDEAKITCLSHIHPIGNPTIMGKYTVYIHIILYIKYFSEPGRFSEWGSLKDRRVRWVMIGIMLSAEIWNMRGYNGCKFFTKNGEYDGL